MPTCQGVYNTGQVDSSGCVIYACPAIDCVQPTCEGFYDTGQKDSFGCPIFGCPGIACTACVGGTPTGQVDSNNCPVYACPTKTCPVGCICEGETMTCPITPTKQEPIEAKIASVGSGTTLVSIQPIEDKLSIRTSKAVAITQDTLIIKENKLFLKTPTGNKEIKILPEEASNKAVEITTVKKIALEEDNSVPIYSVSGTKEAKIFAIFPTTLDIETKVSAESGEIISVNKPWWSFFAW